MSCTPGLTQQKSLCSFLQELHSFKGITSRAHCCLAFGMISVKFVLENCKNRALLALIAVALAMRPRLTDTKMSLNCLDWQQVKISRKTLESTYCLLLTTSTLHCWLLLPSCSPGCGEVLWSQVYPPCQSDLSLACRVINAHLLPLSFGCAQSESVCHSCFVFFLGFCGLP